MRSADDRVRQFLEGNEQSAGEQLARTHGVMRSPWQTSASRNEIGGWNPLQPEATPLQSLAAFGMELQVADRVRLWPQERADIFDVALARDKSRSLKVSKRTIRCISQVVLENDPGRDPGSMRQPGHRFFFSPQEIEPPGLDSEARK